MDLPIDLKLAIEQKVTETKHSELSSDAHSLSQKYRYQSGQGKRLLTQNNEAISYCVVRMPATFGAVSSALLNILEIVEQPIKTLIDVGAGTGAGSWAVSEQLQLENITCLEREQAMREIGESLMKSSTTPSLQKAEWIKYDLTTEIFDKKADLVIASYVLNELCNIDRLKAVQKLWDLTDNVLLLVEPGTTVGYQQLIKTREYLLSNGAYMIAPCSHNKPCQLKDGDWCHFSCRISRSKLHKQLKNASMGYEDEKFSYMAFSKFPQNIIGNRIVRNPMIEKATIKLNICSEDGNKQSIINKKDKEVFKKAKKLKWGDVW